MVYRTVLNLDTASRGRQDIESSYVLGPINEGQLYELKLILH